jgi:hypothetical protein
VKRKAQAEGGALNTVFEIEGTMSHFFARTVVEVSADVFSVLIDADGKKSLHELFEENGVVDDQRRARVLDEMHDLWTQRIVILRPATAIN